MNLVDFVEKVSKEVQSRKKHSNSYRDYLTYDAEKEIEAQLNEDIIFPQEFEKIDCRISGNSLSISAKTLSMDSANLDSTLRLLLENLQSMPIYPPNNIRFHGIFSWQTDKFKQEKKLAKKTLQNVDLSLSAKILNPSPRLPYADSELSRIDVRSFNKGIYVDAHGKYLRYFQELADIFEPNWALLETSDEDNQRIEKSQSRVMEKLDHALMELGAKRLPCSL